MICWSSHWCIETANEPPVIGKDRFLAKFAVFFQCKQGCRNIYNKVKTKEVECGYRAKWNKDLGTHIDNTTWRRVFYLIFNVEQDNNLIWFQYKLIHRILGTNSQMYKMSIEKSYKCRVCQSDSETFIHLFVKCRYVVEL